MAWFQFTTDAIAVEGKDDVIIPTRINYLFCIIVVGSTTRSVSYNI